MRENNRYRNDRSRFHCKEFQCRSQYCNQHSQHYCMCMCDTKLLTMHYMIVHYRTDSRTTLHNMYESLMSSQAPEGTGDQTGLTQKKFCNRKLMHTWHHYLSTPPGSSSMADDNGCPLSRVHVTRGNGIPAVTRHCSRTLPPATTVCIASGYNSTAGGSRPGQKCHLRNK